MEKITVKGVAEYILYKTMIFITGVVVGGVLVGQFVHPLTQEDKAVLDRFYDACINGEGQK
jgi:hypothetical protein